LHGWTGSFKSSKHLNSQSHVLFSFFQIVEVTELSLSANQERTGMEKKRLVWKVEGSIGEEPKVVRGGPVDPAKLVVELAPMEIRTFHVDFDHLQMFGS
jgi:alpha-mannosidase